MKENCAGCRRWFRIGETKHGQCRRNPPTIGFLLIPQVQEYAQLPERFWLARLLARLGLRMPTPAVTHRIERCTSFPNTEEDVWCGDFVRQAKR